MTDEDPFASELAAAAATIRVLPERSGDLLPQLELAQQLLAEAGQGIESASLVYRGRDGKVQLYSVGKELKFGRGAECELCLVGLREISRLHFAITKDEHGTYWISDPG